LHKTNSAKYKDDDISLYMDLNKVKFVEGEKNNFKITDWSDFENLKNIYRSKQNVGIGFDVHRLVPRRRLYLAGLKIKSKLGTLGHSDGDPVLHSITDAILGACQMGDIGQMFSDNNKKFKNIRSTILLKKVLKQIKLKGYFINNIDINIITQTPKIKNLKNKMIENIAKLCEISKTQINIKGKTAEKLGVIGKEKAIACEVITSVIKYD
jgi:2-C-methyl-D-erythritol 4-phosphate cytidylyltransferase/2-C-methyl-D-erythritol 2,4-cyclodiphosphate synthase